METEISRPPTVHKHIGTTITQHSTIGFIGLGAMGQRMARRLLGSGFKLVAYDHTRSKTTALAADGAIPVPSLRQLAMKSEVVISCLPNDEAVLSVYIRECTQRCNRLRE